MNELQRHLSQVTTPTSLRSEPAFDALWSVVNEVDAEASISIIGEKLFSDDIKFNAYLAKHMRVAGFELKWKHWNRLVFCAAGEIPKKYGKYATADIQANPYGAALMFLLLIYVRTYGQGRAGQILYGDLRCTTMDNAAVREIAESAAFKLLAPQPLKRGKSETIQSIVLRKLMNPAQLTESVKRGVRGFIKNQLKTYGHSAVNPLKVAELPTCEELYTTEQVTELTSKDLTADDFQFEYLQELINRSLELFNERELSLFKMWQENWGCKAFKSPTTFAGELVTLAPLLGLSESQARDAAASIVRKIRSTLMLSIRVRYLKLQDYVSKATKHRRKKNKNNATLVQYNKNPVAMTMMVLKCHEYQSPLVDHQVWGKYGAADIKDDFDILLEYARQGKSVFAIVKDIEKEE